MVFLNLMSHFPGYGGKVRGLGISLCDGTAQVSSYIGERTSRWPGSGWLQGSYPSGESAGPCTDLGGGGVALSKRPVRSEGSFQTPNTHSLEPKSRCVSHNGFIFSPPVDVSSSVGEDTWGGKAAFRIMCGLDYCDKHWSGIGKRGACARLM